MKVQHLSQLSSGSDRDVAVGGPRVGSRPSRRTPCARSFEPVAVGPRSRRFNDAARSISRRLGKSAYREIENEMDLGAAKKRENCQLSFWTRHQVHRLSLWILDRGTWPRPNDDMAQSQGLLERSDLKANELQEVSSPPEPRNMAIVIG